METIEKMNRVLANWKSQFDVLSSLNLQFSVTDGHLFFNELPLCLEKGLDLIFARFTAKKIVFSFEGNKTIQILIGWPEDEGPVLSSISLLYHNTDSGK